VQDSIIEDTQMHVLKSKPYSSTVLALGGVILVGLGLYFIFLRPALLPEDPRYMGASLVEIRAAVPGLENWLQKVFWVMGGYMVATGLLTIAVALSIFRARAKGSTLIVAVTGLVSIGCMAVVNFMIGSDFKWVILIFCLPWVIGLVLYQFESRRANGA
jgi:hypothetical protein